jgi:methyl-accepting chemotaxis protein
MKSILADARSTRSLRRAGNVYFAEFRRVAGPHDQHARSAQIDVLTAEVRVMVDGINSAWRDIAADNIDLWRSASRNAKKISHIIGMLDGVAFASSLVTLNAAARAAHPGSEVSTAAVAVQIRGLLQKCAAATTEVQTLLGGTLAKFEASSRLLEEIGATMDLILQSVRHATQVLVESTCTPGYEAAGSLPRHAEDA